MGSSLGISVRSFASSVGIGLLMCSLCAILTGCNNGKQLHADLYQRELRLQEDEIYRLEDYIEEYQAIVRGYRMEVADLKRQLAENGTGETLSTGPTLAEPQQLNRIESSRSTQTAPSFGDAAESNETDPSETADPTSPRPEIDTDQEGLDSLEYLPAPDADEAPRFSPSSAEVPIEEHQPARFTAPNAKKLVRLDSAHSKLLRLSNGASDSSGLSTLLATIQLPEAMLDYRGDISLLLTEPAGTSTQTRERKIARWDFTSEEVALARGDNDAIVLPLLLPNEPGTSPPSGQKLRMWIRLIDSLGRKKLEHVELEFDEDQQSLVDLEPLAVVTPEEQEQPDEQVAQETTQWRRALITPHLSRHEDSELKPASWQEPSSED